MRTEKLEEQLEEMWKVKSKVVLVLIGALGAVTVMLEVWLQQIPGITSEIAVQKSVVLGTAKTRKLSGLCVCSSSSGLLPNHLILGVRGRFLFVCLCICIKPYTMKKGARRFH